MPGTLHQRGTVQNEHLQATARGWSPHGYWGFAVLWGAFRMQSGVPLTPSSAFEFHIVIVNPCVSVAPTVPLKAPLRVCTGGPQGSFRVPGYYPSGHCFAASLGALGAQVAASGDTSGRLHTDTSYARLGIFTAKLNPLKRSNSHGISLGRVM